MEIINDYKKQFQQKLKRIFQKDPLVTIAFKSVIVFSIGVILTYSSFEFFVYQLSISNLHATIMSSVIGLVITLGLIFSYRVRCVMLLLIPQFFSKIGRYILTCYALVLILTGPATNTLRNTEVLSESIACSQEEIKTSTYEIADSAKNPLNSLKSSIKLMDRSLKRATDQMNRIITKINLLVITIGDKIQSSLSWLQSVVTTCNDKFGTPYEHCVNALDKSHLNQNLTKATNLNMSIANVICENLEGREYFFTLADYASGSFAATIRRKLRNFTNLINTMFFINIKVYYSYTYSGNETQSFDDQMASGIVTEIRNRVDPLLTWLSWTSCVTSLFLLLILIRANYYQHMYVTRSRFDNRYITKEFRELDKIRYKEGRETVLPLHRREQTKYITTTSLRLMASERLYLTRSTVLMTITTFKLLIHIAADYSLYWVLMTIRCQGSQQPSMILPRDAAVHISGNGPVADLIRSLFHSFTIPLRLQNTPSSTCLPHPYPPDYHRYAQIASLIALLWFCALFEPYGLRLRHVIMDHYTPERAKARATWLYNHILRTRGSFMKLARRKLHREYKYTIQNKLMFKNWLNSRIPCWCLRYVLGTLPKEKHCLLCAATKEDKSNCDRSLVSCDSPRCPGVYCFSCFSDLGELCTICLPPADYGDMSDVSLEGTTSESNDESNVELN